jgi:hypothetical protein
VVGKGILNVSGVVVDHEVPKWHRRDDVSDTVDNLQLPVLPNTGLTYQEDHGFTSVPVVLLEYYRVRKNHYYSSTTGTNSSIAEAVVFPGNGQLEVPGYYVVHCSTSRSRGHRMERTMMSQGQLS